MWGDFLTGVFLGLVGISAQISAQTLVPEKIAKMLGNETGNGGDVVVCGQDGATPDSVELLDYYEARMFEPRFDVNLGSDDASFESKVKATLLRLQRFTQLRAQDLLGWYSSFWQETDLVAGIVLRDISDSGHVGIPAGCAVQQIAIQRPRHLPGQKRYIINKDLWDHLDPDNKAGLVLHELLYRMNLNEGHQNSIITRFLNGYVSSEQLGESTHPEHWKMMANLGYSDVDIDGIWINSKSIQVFGDGFRAAPSDTTHYQKHGHSFWVSNRYSYVRFSSDLMLIAREAYDDYWTSDFGRVNVQGSHRQLMQGELLLHSNGLVKQAKFWRSEDFHDVCGNTTSVNKGTIAQFDEAGRLIREC